jgi:hypothetical protein
MRGLPCPKDIPPNAGELEEEKSTPDQHAESDYHRQDEQVSNEMMLVDAVVAHVGFKLGVGCKLRFAIKRHLQISTLSLVLWFYSIPVGSYWDGTSN